MKCLKKRGFEFELNKQNKKKLPFRHLLKLYGGSSVV